MLVILVGYPLLRSAYLVGVAILNGATVNAELLVDPLLLLPLGFLFYRAFQGDRRARIPIVLFVIAIGTVKILAALVFSLLLDPVSSALGWVVTGAVEIGFGLFIYQSTEIEAYIASRKERKAFGDQEPK